MSIHNLATPVSGPSTSSSTSTSSTSSTSSSSTSSVLSMSPSQMMSNPFAISPKTLILTQIFTMINTFCELLFPTDTSNATWHMGLLKIVVLLGISYISINFDIMFNIIKKFTIGLIIRFLSFLFFKNEIIKLTEINQFNHKIVMDNYNFYGFVYQKTLSEILNNSLIDTSKSQLIKYKRNYIWSKHTRHNDDYNGTNNLKLSYLRFWKPKVLRKCKKIAQDKSISRDKVVKIITSINNGNRVISSEKKQQAMFPYKKYNNLCGIIKNYFEINNLINNKRPVALVLNGPPGTGKTSFCDYISQQNICKNIIKINLMNFVNKDFVTISNSIKQSFQINDGYLICFDELDKYFNVFLQNKIKSLTTNIEDEDEDEDKGKGKINVKTDTDLLIRETSILLTELYKLIDGDELPYNVVFVFCANNFNTIFKYASDHFDALKDRLIYENIYAYSIDDVYQFLIYYNKFFHNTERHLPEEKINKCINELPSDTLITARKLYQLLIKNHYNIIETIQNIPN